MPVSFCVENSRMAAPAAATTGQEDGVAQTEGPIFGLQLPCVPDLASALVRATTQQVRLTSAATAILCYDFFAPLSASSPHVVHTQYFDFVSVPLFHSRFTRRSLPGGTFFLPRSNCCVRAVSLLYNTPFHCFSRA